MSRGDRSRQGRERSAEERERDREERARRRASRTGGKPADAIEPDNAIEPLRRTEPEADLAQAPSPSASRLAPDAAASEAAAFEAATLEAAASEADAAFEAATFQGAAFEAGALDRRASHEPAPGEPLPEPIDTTQSDETEMHALRDPAHVYAQEDPPLSAAAYERRHAPEHEAAPEPEPEPATEHVPAPEPGHELASEHEPAAQQVRVPEHPIDPEPALGPGSATAPDATPESGPEPDPAASPAPHEVPAAASPRRARPGRGARRSPGGHSRGSSAHRGRRSLAARLGAVVALLAVGAAVVLLIHSLTASEAKPVAAPAVVKVLIPEGETRAQIAQIAAHYGLRGNYRLASRRSPLLDPAHYGAPANTPDLEGFLFPATYDEYPGAPVSRLVSDQLTAFNENFSSSIIARAHALHVTPYQLLIVASMVEREALIPGDRAKIAAVIYNRLRLGMPLGIDATLYYAVELEKGIATYTHELTEAQLHIDSPYNTRTHVGLPPTPISNPGLASIEAAANPAHVPYLYYVAGADGCGEQVFSNTLAEFEAHDAEYKAAVAKNGGHPPSCKKS